MQCGYDIVKGRMGHSSCYYLNKSSLDIAEIKIIFDAINAAKFITKKKTNSLINKLIFIAGGKKVKDLEKTCVKFDTVKQENENIFYSIDTISSAIIDKKQIAFKYFGYDVSCKKIYKKGGEKYKANPVTLVFYDQYYYLVAYHDEEFKLRNYRVDKMEKVEKLDTDITPSDCAGDINYNLHPSKAFSMFYGKTEDVVLLCENSLSSSIVDRFGKVKMTERSDGYFTVKVPYRSARPSLPGASVLKTR